MSVRHKVGLLLLTQLRQLVQHDFYAMCNLQLSSCDAFEEILFHLPGREDHGIGQKVREIDKGIVSL
jgi:hypothetical protein